MVYCKQKANFSRKAQLQLRKTLPQNIPEAALSITKKIETKKQTLKQAHTAHNKHDTPHPMRHGTHNWLSGKQGKPPCRQCFLHTRSTKTGRMLNMLFLFCSKIHRTRANTSWWRTWFSEAFWASGAVSSLPLPSSLTLEGASRRPPEGSLETELRT